MADRIRNKKHTTSERGINFKNERRLDTIHTIGKIYLKRHETNRERRLQIYEERAKNQAPLFDNMSENLLNPKISLE